MAKGRTEILEAGKLVLLPPADGKCRICAVDHEPEQAHNARSVFYAVRFRLRHGRDGTWADAVAHCPPAVRDHWRRELERAGAWTEPPAGVEPVAEPIDG